MSASERRPRPPQGAEHGPVFDAYQRRELLVHVCETCGQTMLPVGPTCFFCSSHALREESLAHELRGTIYSFTVSNRGFLDFADAAPYTVVLIDVEGHPGLRQVGNLMPSPPHTDWPRLVGRAVVSTWVTYADDVVLPQWELAPDAAPGRTAP